MLLVIKLLLFFFRPSLFLPSHLLDPHTALTKEGDMERLCSTHHSSSSIASSSHWSPPLPCPSGRSCCQCLLRILITLYLFIFVCSYVVFLSINSAGKSTKNANSESHSLESELSHSTPSSVLCKLRDSSVQVISSVSPSLPSPSSDTSTKKVNTVICLI